MKRDYSVLMAVYKNDNPEYLKISIDSMLNQTIKPNEFVLVEDGELTDELYKTIDLFVTDNPNLFKIVFWYNG